MQPPINEIFKQLKSFGISELDASLIADCINNKKECLWQNNDLVTQEAVEKANKYLIENKLGMIVSANPSRFDKFIWETKKIK